MADNLINNYDNKSGRSLSKEKMTNFCQDALLTEVGSGLAFFKLSSGF